MSCEVRQEEEVGWRDLGVSGGEAQKQQERIKKRGGEEKEGEVWAEMRRLAYGSGMADSCRNSLLLLH